MMCRKLHLLQLSFLVLLSPSPRPRRLEPPRRRVLHRGEPQLPSTDTRTLHRRRGLRQTLHVTRHREHCVPVQKLDVILIARTSKQKNELTSKTTQGTIKSPCPPRSASRCFRRLPTKTESRRSHRRAPRPPRASPRRASPRSRAASPTAACFDTELVHSPIPA